MHFVEFLSLFHRTILYSCYILRFFFFSQLLLRFIRFLGSVSFVLFYFLVLTMYGEGKKNFRGLIRLMEASCLSLPAGKMQPRVSLSFLNGLGLLRRFLTADSFCRRFFGWRVFHRRFIFLDTIPLEYSSRHLWYGGYVFPSFFSRIFSPSFSNLCENPRKILISHTHEISSSLKTYNSSSYLISVCSWAFVQFSYVYVSITSLLYI